MPDIARFPSSLRLRAVLASRISSAGLSLSLHQRRLISAASMSVVLHVVVIATSGGGEHSGKAFGRFVEAPPRRVMKVELAKAQEVGTKSSMPLLPPPLEFPRPDSEKPLPPAPHIGQHSPGEGERQQVATPLTEFPYYSIKELTKGPQVLTTVNPEFERMDHYEAGGRMVLTIWINEQGIVDAVTVDRSNLPQKVDEQVRASFLGAHFAPGEKDGHKVRSKMPVEVNYEPLNMVTPIRPLPRQK